MGMIPTLEVNGRKIGAMTEDDLEKIGFEDMYMAIQAYKEQKDKAKLHRLKLEEKQVDHFPRALREETFAGDHMAKFLEQDEEQVRKVCAEANLRHNERRRRKHEEALKEKQLLSCYHKAVQR